MKIKQILLVVIEFTVLLAIVGITVGMFIYLAVSSQAAIQGMIKHLLNN
jgi:hypothetical protein